MKRIQIIGILTAFLLAAPATAGQIKVAAYDLDVEFIPDRHFMTAVARIHFDPAAARPDSLTFFLHGELRVDSLAIGDQEVAVSQSPVFYYYDYSLIARKAELAASQHDLADGITVWYSGYLHPSKARTPSDYMRIDPEGVLLRSYGYSLWIPIFLEARQDSYDVSFSRARIKTPADFLSVFVGERTGTRIDGESRITEWRTEGVDLMDIQCTARRFAAEQEGSYHVYYLPKAESQDRARRIIQFTRDLTEFFRTRYRRSAVPDQIHIMQMPEFGDISCANVAGISADKWHDFHQEMHSQVTLAHELVHPFVQIPVAMADPIYALVVEGFPSYFHFLALDGMLGEGFLARDLADREAGYLRKRDPDGNPRFGSLPVEKPLCEISPDEIGTYKDRFVLCDRALLFLDYVRRSMGTERFFAFTEELFQLDSLDYGLFKQIVLKYWPHGGKDLDLWLETTDFPDRFRLN